MSDPITDTKYSSTGKSIGYNYYVDEPNTSEVTSCYVKVSQTTGQYMHPSSHALRPETVHYEVECKGWSSDRAKLIDLFRRLADDLANHDFGDA